jgi:hypothetical protein
MQTLMAVDDCSACQLPPHAFEMSTASTRLPSVHAFQAHPHRTGSLSGLTIATWLIFKRLVVTAQFERFHRSHHRR